MVQIFHFLSHVKSDTIYNNLDTRNSRPCILIDRYHFSSKCMHAFTWILRKQCRLEFQPPTLRREDVYSSTMSDEILKSNSTNGDDSFSTSTIQGSAPLKPMRLFLSFPSVPVPRERIRYLLQSGGPNIRAASRIASKVCMFTSSLRRIHQ